MNTDAPRTEAFAMNRPPSTSRRRRFPARVRTAAPDRDRRIPAGPAVALAVALGLLLLTGTSLAAQTPTPAPAQERPVALVGGTVHTVTGGVIDGGTVLFEDGTITAVGRDVEIPAGAERVDVSGRGVYPGLVDAYTTLGLYEIGAVGTTVDVRELGEVNANLRPELAVNPESRHIGTARSNGVLVAVTSPGGGLVPGLSAALQLDGWTWEDLTLRSGVALNVEWPRPDDEDEYEGRIEELREVFASARAYRDARRSGRPHDTDSRWEAMVPVVEGDVPVVVSADELRQIQDAVTWAEEEGVRLVLRGGEDALYVADHLAEKDVPLLLTSVMDAPERSWEPYDRAYGLPARLDELGVRFAIAGSSSAPYTNRLPYEAGVAVAFGLSRERALEAVTIEPARILGIDDRVGSIEPGKDATLLVADGHPLDHLGRVEQAWVRGRAIDMVDAHRWFYEKYSEKVRQRARSDGDGGG